MKEEATERAREAQSEFLAHLGMHPREDEKKGTSEGEGEGEDFDQEAEMAVP